MSAAGGGSGSVRAGRSATAAVSAAGAGLDPIGAPAALSAEGRRRLRSSAATRSRTRTPAPASAPIRSHGVELRLEPDVVPGAGFVGAAEVNTWVTSWFETAKLRTAVVVRARPPAESKESRTVAV